MDTTRIRESKHHLWEGGTFKQGGYVMVRVNHHPRQNKRGYVPEHRLIMEEYLRRYLLEDETIHHKNGIRDDNRLENLELKVNHSQHIREAHQGERNPNHQFIASDPKFEQEKYRLYDKDRGTTHIYTLAKLIGTTFRRGCFEYRGKWSGLKDKNGKEIYEGDIVKRGMDKRNLEVYWHDFTACWRMTGHTGITKGDQALMCEVIGDIYENQELLKGV